MVNEKAAAAAEVGSADLATTPHAAEAATMGRNTKHDDLAAMTANARAATDKEHKMSLMQGIRLYPKAAAWSMLISCCIIMEGEF